MGLLNITAVILVHLSLAMKCMLSIDVFNTWFQSAKLFIGVGGPKCIFKTSNSKSHFVHNNKKNIKLHQLC